MYTKLHHIQEPERIGCRFECNFRWNVFPGDNRLRILNVTKLKRQRH